MGDNPSYCRKEKRKAQKDYRCECCGMSINKRMVYMALVGVWEGQMQTIKIHVSCYESYQKFCNAYPYYEDEFPAFQELLELLHEAQMISFI